MGLNSEEWKFSEREIKGEGWVGEDFWRRI